MSKSFSELVAAMSCTHRPPVMDSAVAELVSARVQASRRRLNGRRINLVLPVIKEAWSYGGVATAVRLFERMAAEFSHARIILLNQAEADFEFDAWPDFAPEGTANRNRTVACMEDRAEALEICADDYFLATFWSTATYVRQIAERQAELFGMAPRRYVYLIQDYEPGFYPWSYRYSCALATYLDISNTIAVFNSQLLADFFRRRGLGFGVQFVYEPVLNPQLRVRRDALRDTPKERMIIVYGRPSVPRNAFELVVEVLKKWARIFPDASEWTVISAGEQHEDVTLGNGVTLVSRGKLSLQDYSVCLSRSWAGLSFMMSVHPSYPPLEMAEFGGWVVTNGFEGKDLSKWAPNILSIENPTAEAAAQRLAWCCSQYRAGRARAIESVGAAFRGTEPEFPFVPALMQSWQREPELHALTVGSG